MMESLYELTGDYKRLEELEEELDPQTFKDTMDSIKGAIEEKAVGYASVIKQFQADAKMLRDEEIRLSERRHAIETKIGLMQESLFEAMEIAGTGKIKSPKFTVWIQNNPASVRVDNEEALKEYMVEQPKKLDKRSLLEDLKQGVEVYGAELQQTRSLRIK